MVGSRNVAKGQVSTVDPDVGANGQEAADVGDARYLVEIVGALKLDASLSVQLCSPSEEGELSAVFDSGRTMKDDGPVEGEVGEDLDLGVVASEKARQLLGPGIPIVVV